MKINKVGCRVSEDVCIVHDEPLICRHGCSEAKDHKCPDIMTKPIAQSPKPWMAPEMREIAKQSCGYCGEEYYHKNTCQTILYGKTKINKHGK